MRALLKDIASVHMGYSFRSSLEHMERGPVAVVQMRDVRDEATVDVAGAAQVAVDGVREHHLLQPGDLVFRTRGNSATAAVVTDVPGRAVAAAPLLRLRPDPQRVSSSYLAWYLAQQPAQAALWQNASGSVQLMINKQNLENLEITLPPLREQAAIGELAALAARERVLMHEIAERRAKVTSALLLKFVEGKKS